ncbi:MAG: hypothetical protein EP338_08800 [Bacteroidetes bacterium]|nr:MAG: hypothetical protein EP338_08800 [Bacteroidota bacterium]
MVETFKHILDLDFDWLVREYQTAIYFVLFIVIFVETGLVAMPFLPGDSLLFTAGLFARTMPEHLQLTYIIGLLIVAAVLGDNVNYWVGRTIGLKVFSIKIRGRNIVKKEYLEKTQEFFERKGTVAIILARFVPIVRTFSPFAAGVGKMNYRRFVTFDILGGVLWICSLTIAGYLLGEITWIREHIDLVCLGIILLSVLPMIIAYLKAKFGKKNA